MLFRKNLPARERAIRLFIGLSLMCVGMLFAPEAWMKWSALAGGAMAACTGFIGFCPMCAVAGRKL
jgi:hypothetical protein